MCREHGDDLNFDSFRIVQLHILYNKNSNISLTFEPTHIFQKKKKHFQSPKFHIIILYRYQQSSVSFNTKRIIQVKKYYQKRW